MKRILKSILFVVIIASCQVHAMEGRYQYKISQDVITEALRKGPESLEWINVGKVIKKQNKQAQKWLSQSARRKLEAEFFQWVSSYGKKNRDDFFSFLKRGFCLHSTDKNGKTVLHHLCDSDEEEFFKLALLSGFENINAQADNGQIPLNAACGSGKISFVKMLLALNMKLHYMLLLVPDMQDQSKVCCRL